MGALNKCKSDPPPPHLSSLEPNKQASDHSSTSLPASGLALGGCTANTVVRDWLSGLVMVDWSAVEVVKLSGWLVRLLPIETNHNLSVLSFIMG